MKKFLAKRPWIWVIFAFLLLIGAWSIFINIAVNNQPEKVPLEHLEEPATTETENARD